MLNCSADTISLKGTCDTLHSLSCNKWYQKLVLVEKWNLYLGNMLFFIFMMLIVPALTIRQESDTLGFNELYKDFKYGRRHRPINRKICKYHIRVVSFQHCPRKGICQIFNMRQRVQTCSTWTKTKYFDIAGYLVLKYVVQKGKKVL